jgi:hypothetical protein
MSRLARASLVLFLSLLVSALASGCSASRPTATEHAPDEAELDLSALMHRTHFGFRRDGDAFVGNLKGYASRVDARGAVALTPSVARSSARATAVLATRVIARGETRFDGAPAVTSLPSGEVQIARGEVVERLENRTEGVEQSWRFARLPRGRGPLRVHVSVGGMRLDRETASGLHLVDDRTGARLRYGRPTWIDREGTRVAASLRAVEGEILIEVAAETVEGSVYPAILDPVVGPELAVDEPVLSEVSYAREFYDVRVSPGKNGTFLVAWIDERALSPDYNSIFGYGEIWGARVSAAGVLLDPTGILLAPQNSHIYQHLELAYDGASNWLVAYSKFGPGAVELVVERVSDAGVLLDPAGVLVSNMNLDRAPAVGFDGSAFTLVWTNNQNDGLHLSRVSPAGALLTPLPLDLGPGARSIGGIACDPAGTCAIAYAAGSPEKAYVARVSKTGTVLDPSGILVGAGRPGGIVFDGTNFFVFSEAGGGLAAAHVSPGGAVLDGFTYPNVYIEAVAFDGTNALVASSGGGTIVGTRIAKDGTQVDATPLVLQANAPVTSLGLAFGGGQYVLAWHHYTTPTYFTRVTTAGVSVDGAGVVLNKVANQQLFPAVAGDSGGYLVAWMDGRIGGGETTLWATRLSGAGAPLDPLGIAVADGAVIGGGGEAPSVATDGTTYLVVWAGARARLVDKATGGLGPIITLPLTNGGARIGVAFDGANYVVASEGKLVRLSPAGALVDATAIVFDAGPVRDVDLAYDGANLMAVYESGEEEVRAVRFAKSGVVLDAPPILLKNATRGLHYPHVFWDGQQYVALWGDYRNAGGVESDIFAARVTAGGSVLDPGGFFVGIGNPHQTFVAGIDMKDGFSDLIVWTEQRPGLNRDYDLLGRFIRKSDRTFIDPDPVVISAARGNELEAALAPHSTGRVLALYSRNDDASGFGAHRIRGRFVSSGQPVGTTCGAATTCASRACADGFCCDTACSQPCRRCGVTPGTCTVVTAGDDPDTCAGDKTCDATGQCKVKDGVLCVVDSDCANGHCAAGICCDRACDGACETCASPSAPGKCTLRATHAAGSPACAPYACDGANAGCPTRCASDSACPSSARCDVASGSCVSGSYCLDATMLGGVGADPVSCAPYTCESAACRTACRDVHDCTQPAVCDERGECAVVPAAGSGDSKGGCVVAPGGTPAGEAGLHLALVLGAALGFAGRRRRAPVVSARSARSGRRPS